MQITVIGTGYVGLVTGTCLAETGNQVVCVDIDENKIMCLNNGETPIYEPGLETILKRNIQLGNLQFTTNLKEGISNTDVIFLALPTPPKEDGSADLSFLLNVTHELVNLIQSYTVIVTKSTVPVGTGDRIEDILSDHLESDLFDVVSNPEFLREGCAIEDFMRPDRIVIGTSSNEAKEIMMKIYRPYVRQNNPIIYMDRRSSEITKYASNSYLATRISFMNEVANICEAVDADVDLVRMGMGSDSRIGKRFLFPGIGYGGSCFPKDVKALLNTASQNGYDFQILDAVNSVNSGQKKILTKKILAHFNGSIQGKTIAMWGLAFKPNTDDIREAPALVMIDEFIKRGAHVKVFDPEAMINVRRIYGNKLIYGINQYEILEGSDALVIATEWSNFRTPDFRYMKNLMSQPLIFDGRNMYDIEELKSLGFNYECIGRNSGLTLGINQGHHKLSLAS